MKVAVLSVEPMLGKTLFCSLFGGVFARSQHKEVSILSTGLGVDNIEISVDKIGSNTLDNPHIFKAMLENVGEEPRHLFNYGIRQGEEPVFIYDIMSSKMSDEDKLETLLNAINTLPSHLTLVEITGDPMSERNQAAIKECDCAIIMIDQSLKSLRTFKEFTNTVIPKKLREACIYVFGLYEPTVLSDKKVTSVVKDKTLKFFKFRYLPILRREAIDSNIEKVPYEIITGNFEVVELRQQFYDIMSELYDTKERKIIRGINEWYK